MKAMILHEKIYSSRTSRVRWNVLRKTRPLLASIGLLTVLSSIVHATLVTEIGLNEMISESRLIVEGTVVDITSQWSEGKTTIHTYVTLDDLRVVHGKLENPTVALRFEGGEIGSYRITIEGAPSFRVGEREFLFLSGNDEGISPIVGLFQGRFKVIDGQVHDYAGVPIVAIKDNVLVKIVEPPDPTSGDRDQHRPLGGVTIGNPVKGEYSYTATNLTDDEEKQLEALRLQAEPATDASQAESFPAMADEADELPSVPPSGHTVAPLGPPVPVEENVSLYPAQKPVSVFLEPWEDTGQRLSVEDFIDAIRARLIRK